MAGDPSDIIAPVAFKSTAEYPILVQAGDLLREKYRVERILGTGAMGVVVAATHVKLGQTVAIKLLRNELKGTQRVVQRFMREARAASRLSGDNAVRILDVDETDGRPFIVMEFLDGEDLSHRLGERGPLPYDEATEYLLQACEGIAEAHKKGIVHRDLKPANLFLTARADGSPLIKILDLGISKVLVEDEHSHQLTGPSSVLGSPSYMSPEQLRNPTEVDARSDIWSLGVVLYQLLTKRLPFSATNSAALAAHIAADPPKRPDLEGPAKMLEPIMKRCLEKRPDDRYRDVAELAEALAPLLPRGAEQAARVRRILDETNQDEPSPAGAVAPPAGDPFAALAEATGSWPARKHHLVYLVPLLIPVLLLLSWIAGRHRHAVAPARPVEPPRATVEQIAPPPVVVTPLPARPRADEAPAAAPSSPPPREVVVVRPTPAAPTRRRATRPRVPEAAPEKNPMDIDFK
jgi:serine/threonine-protein kinase